MMEKAKFLMKDLEGLEASEGLLDKFTKRQLCGKKLSNSEKKTSLQIKFRMSINHGSSKISKERVTFIPCTTQIDPFS